MDYRFTFHIVYLSSPLPKKKKKTSQNSAKLKISDLEELSGTNSNEFGYASSINFSLSLSNGAPSSLNVPVSSSNNIDYVTTSPSNVVASPSN